MPAQPVPIPVSPPATEPAEPEIRAADAAVDADAAPSPAPDTAASLDEAGEAAVPGDVAGNAPSSPIRVAFYRARGVGEDALEKAVEALGAAGGFEVAQLSPEDVREGSLDGRDVAVFTGGIGSVQGRLLEEEGRSLVRAFVRAGGGYVGICAGSYLAIQGPPRYHHIAMVAARNWSGDAWRRGIDMLEVRPTGGESSFRLFYANGPVFRPDPREDLTPYVPLAEYLSDKYCADCGTGPGEMPGTPAILAAVYGEGRVLLFSPNPVLAEGDEAAHPELFVAAVRWVAAGGPVDPALRFDDVFR
jgi:putative intracellular protease/amidase